MKNKEILHILQKCFREDKILYTKHARDEMRLEEFGEIYEEEKEMKCVICKSGNIVERSVEEEFKMGKNIIFIPIQTMVCEECGERYYSRETMRKLEKLEREIRQKKISLKEVGHVLKPV